MLFTSGHKKTGSGRKSLLPNFTAALNARRASPSTARQARIMTLGHSWTSGSGAGSGGSTIEKLTNCMPFSWSEKLCQYLTSAGCNTVRNSFMGTQHTASADATLAEMDPRVVLSADTVPGPGYNYIGGRPLVIPGNGAAPYAQFTPGLAFTKFKIWGTADSVFSEDTELYVDGVSKLHINSGVAFDFYAFPGATSSRLTYAYSGSSIKLINRSATKSFQLSGMEVFGGGYDAYDAVLTMSGQSGSTLADHVASPGSNTSRINTVPRYGVDLLTLQMMYNDANGASFNYTADTNSFGTAVAEANLTTILNTWKSNIGLIYAKNPTADIIIIGDADSPTGGATPYIMQRYHTAAKEVIATQGRGIYVDLRLVWGTYSDSIALGYRNNPTDTNHPSALGHAAIGQQLAQAIAAGI